VEMKSSEKIEQLKKKLAEKQKADLMADVEEKIRERELKTKLMDKQKADFIAEHIVAETEQVLLLSSKEQPDKLPEELRDERTIESYNLSLTTIVDLFRERRRGKESKNSDRKEEKESKNPDEGLFASLDGECDARPACIALFVGSPKPCAQGSPTRRNLRSDRSVSQVEPLHGVSQDRGHLDRWCREMDHHFYEQFNCEGVCWEEIKEFFNYHSLRICHSDSDSVLGQAEWLLLYYSGHGRQCQDRKSENGDWVLRDRFVALDDILAIWAERVAEEEAIQEEKRKKVVLVIISDSCYSGGWIARFRKANPRGNVVIVSSCGVDQSAGEDELGGLFTQLFMRKWQVDKHFDKLGNFTTSQRPVFCASSDACNSVIEALVLEDDFIRKIEF